MFGEMRSWPELVGTDGNQAVQKIKQESGRIVQDIFHVRFF